MMLAFVTGEDDLPHSCSAFPDMVEMFTDMDRANRTMHNGRKVIVFPGEGVCRISIASVSHASRG